MSLTGRVGNLRQDQLEVLVRTYQIETTGTLDKLRRQVVQHFFTMPGQVKILYKSNTGATNSFLSRIVTDNAHVKTMNQIHKWRCHFDGGDPLSFLERITEFQQKYLFSDA